VRHDEKGAADDDSSSTSSSICGTGMPCEASARMTRNSRSIACADGSSFATGPGLLRIT
jgi:hypothetical protein